MMMNSVKNHYDEDYHCIIDANDKMESYFQMLKSRQNALLGSLASLFMISILIFIWCQLTIRTGITAHGIIVLFGLGVGLSMHYVGKGIEYTFGWYGLAITACGILCGSYFNRLAKTYVDSATPDTNLLDMFFELSPFFIFNGIWNQIDFIDTVFCLIACFLGFRLSFRVVGHNEVIKHIGVNVNDKIQFHKRDED